VAANSLEFMALEEDDMYVDDMGEMDAHGDSAFDMLGEAEQA
jgi:hypothetical protein